MNEGNQNDIRSPARREVSPPSRSPAFLPTTATPLTSSVLSELAGLGHALAKSQRG
jgi:hypothetical protein